MRSLSVHKMPLCIKQGTLPPSPCMPVANAFTHSPRKSCAMRVVAGIALLPALLVVMILRATASGTTITLFREPSASFVRRYLERQDAEEGSANHPFAGFSDPSSSNGWDCAAPSQPPPGFQQRTVRVHLGGGKGTYERGREVLLQWRMHEGSSWARIVLGQAPVGPNLQRNMATVAKSLAGLAWCINPCQIMYERRDAALRFLAPPGTDPNQPRDFVEAPENNAETPKRLVEGKERKPGRLWAGKAPTSAPKWATFMPGSQHKGKQSAVAYATKAGHLIQGEERMRVLHFCGRGGDDSVWFEVYSVSRGAGFVGTVVFPFVQSMQRRFFRDQAETMRVITSSLSTPSK